MVFRMPQPRLLPFFCVAFLLIIIKLFFINSFASERLPVLPKVTWFDSLPNIGPYGQQYSNNVVDSKETRCANLHSSGLRDVALVLKTGATEIQQKLPVHATTTFECVDDAVIYSDLAQTVANFTVKDALANLTPLVLERAGDQTQYTALIDHVRAGGDPAELRGKESWKLDRYKFLPMISDAYATFGYNKKWYFFIEADTHLSLHNLLLWLRVLDPKERIYAGAQVEIRDTEFGHGGSGILLSAPAVKALSETYLGAQEHWDEKAAKGCCGDMATAEVLLAANPPIGILRAFPLIQGETPVSLDWGKTHWCKPAVTWHHVNAAEVKDLWTFEAQWRTRYGAAKPALFKDYYAHFIHPRLTAANGSLEAWDNLSADYTFNADNYNPALESADACEAFCAQHRRCLQWAWRPGSCRGDIVVRFGWSLNQRPELGSAEGSIEKLEGEEQGAVSGWMMERIERYRKKREPCPDEGFWITENEPE